MKKIFAVLLVVMMVVPGVVLSEEPVHLLWDIPFGISKEQSISILLDKTGIVAEERPMYEGSEYMVTESIEGQNATFLGYPIGVGLEYDKDDRLIVISLDVGETDGFSRNFARESYLENGPKKSEFIKRGLAEYGLIWEKFVEQYGGPSGGHLSVWNNEEGSYDGKDHAEYNYPTENGILSLDHALQAIEMFENATLTTYFDNIIVSFYCFSKKDNILDYSTVDAEIMYCDISNDEVIEAEIQWTSFDGKDGEYAAIKRDIQLGF